MIEEKTIEDRKPLIDCLLIKTLKVNKIMNIEKLIHSVNSLSKFKCDEKLIMERIEYLVSGEFIFMEGTDYVKYFS